MSHDYKVCSFCGQSKPATSEYFHKCKTGRDGLRCDCKECVREKHKKYDLSANAKRWRLRNPEKQARSRAKWRENNRDHIRQYNAMTSHLYARLRKEAEGSFSDKDIQLIYNRQRGRCWWCGVSVGDNYHIDHRIPVSKGGKNDASNLVVSCPSCNLSKSNKLPHEWCGRLL